MLKILTGEASIGLKRKNQRQNDQKLWINMRSLLGFIITSKLKFTGMISCMYILRQCHRRTILQIQKKAGKYNKM